jgi:bacteriocin biosynthesis cyclodehydratase domain-containing protein
MMTKPQFKRSFVVQVVPPRHVFLLNEHRYFVLEGEIYPLLVPLLDGQHTIEDILTEIGGQVSFQKVIYALQVLERKEYIVEANDLPPEVAAFWDYLNVDGAAADRTLREARVAVRAVGEVDTEPLVAALHSMGIQPGSGKDFEIVVTDDYLRDELAVINEWALAEERPWMLLKPEGTVLWLGPIFRPGFTGCWACLAQRLQFNRQVEGYIARQKSGFKLFQMPRAMLPSTLHTGMNLAALEIARWLVQTKNERLEGKLLTLDLLSLEIQEHVLVQRPQCPVCGEEVYRTPAKPQPIVLHSQSKRYRGDGGHRAALPQETFDRYKHHISPLIGAVIFVSRLHGDKESGLAFSYLAGHNFAMGVESVIFLNNTLRGQSGGKGTTDIQAKTSALCEAIERYSGIFWDNDYAIKGTYTDLQPEAIHPNTCMLFSEKQYEQRDHWNKSAAKYHIVPLPFDESLEIDWTPIYSLSHDRFRYIPTAYCYYGHPDFNKLYFCSPDSNGSAAGNTLEEAILQGLMEIIERDSVAIWWYNRIKRPAVDLDSFDLPYLRQLQAYYASINRELWVLDITGEFNIPTFAGVSRRTDSPVEDVVVGFGAHLDPTVALLRAITEVNQFLPSVMGQNPDGTTHYLFPDQGAVEWWQSATIENQPYLVPDAALPVRQFEDIPRLDSDDLKQDVQRCVDILRQHDLEVLVLDQTRPDLGLNVVKVIVPGLRHFWRRLGPGRLYDIPVKLGWLPEPLREDQLNPSSVFF